MKYNFHLSLEQLQDYPEYRNLKVAVRPTVERDHKSALPSDPIIKLIYAPDPVTGIPRSDIGLEYSSDVSDELHSYIRSRLQHPYDNGSAGEDADFALQSIKDRRESEEQYFDRLRQICNPE